MGPWHTMCLVGVSRRVRNVKYHETQVQTRHLERRLRRIAVTGLVHDQPTLFLINDPDIMAKALVERYGRRLNIEIV